jgi:hypothetical protein
LDDEKGCHFPRAPVGSDDFEVDVRLRGDPMIGRVGSVIGGFVAGVLLTFLMTVAAYVYAMGTALCWPLSDPNLRYALEEGAIWGAVGGIIVGTVTGAVTGAIQPRLRLAALMVIVGLGSVAWAGISSFCFYVVVVAVAGS